MEAKLSAGKFLWNNKRQAGTIMLAVTVSFLAMYVIYFLVSTTQESFKPGLLEAPKHFICVNPTAETLGICASDYETDDACYDALFAGRDALIAELKDHEGIADAYYTQLLNVSFHSIVGTMGYDFPLMETEQIPEFLAHMDAKLTDGRLPQNDGEILIDRRLLVNNGFQVGDIFFENYYGKTFRIAGVIESKSQVCVGVPNGYTNSGWAIVILCDEQTSDAEALFADCGISLSENDQVADRPGMEADFHREVTDVIDAAMTMLMLVIIVFLSVAVLVAYVSFLRSRTDEYCLYLSIGYSRKGVYGMIMREVLIIFAVSLLAGAVCSLLVMLLLVRLLIDPMGLSYCYWYPDYLLTLVAAYTAIIGVLQLPILSAINRVRTIDGIEER